MICGKTLRELGFSNNDSEEMVEKYLRHLASVGEGDGQIRLEDIVNMCLHPQKGKVIRAGYMRYLVSLL